MSYVDNEYIALQFLQRNAMCVWSVEQEELWQVSGHNKNSFSPLNSQVCSTLVYERQTVCEDPVEQKGDSFWVRGWKGAYV